MKIHIAQHLGMCFGVQDAIQLAALHPNPADLTVLGELVHNPVVLDRLRARGLQFESQLDRVKTAEVMITAHGTSRKNLEEIRARGFTVLEATCPLVHSAHRALANLAQQGCFPIVIGKAGHVEVRGLIGDLPDSRVVLSEDDIASLPCRERYGVVAQTTQPIEKVRALVGSIRAHFPRSEVRFIDTVCQPTKQRQTAAIELARRCDVVIVIGGRSSNNTRELVATCRRFCARVHHVERASDLLDSWFAREDVVGVTAGTSTPAETIDEVTAWLNDPSRQFPSQNGPDPGHSQAEIPQRLVLETPNVASPK